MDVDDHILKAHKNLLRSFFIALPFAFSQLILELLYYPLDTWKTRLQYKSIYGMDNSNGTKTIYRGLLITVLFSAPLILVLTHFFIGILVFFRFYSFKDAEIPHVILVNAIGIAALCLTYVTICTCNT